MTDKRKDAQSYKVKKSCSDEMMKPRYGVIVCGDDMPKPLPMPYERMHKNTRWLL